MLSDKDMANDLLEMTKHGAVEFTKACTEASNSQLRRTFQQLAEKCIASQDDIYRLSEQNNWYQSPPPADHQQLSSLRQTYEKQIMSPVS